MEFIERFLGVSPDDGTGATELVLAILPVIIFFLVAAHRRYLSRT
jgi:hypothetical protein